MTDYFTADWHFGHSNIIIYCDRPFETTQQMDGEIIKRYNERVKEGDTCYVLGDVGFFDRRNSDKLRAIMSRLNGRKILLVGNHDHMPAQDYVECGFESVHTLLPYKENYMMAHDPALYNMLPGKILLCGHVHKFFKRHANAINVGVDVWDYYPVSFDELVRYIND